MGLSDFLRVKSPDLLGCSYCYNIKISKFKTLSACIDDALEEKHVQVNFLGMGFILSIL